VSTSLEVISRRWPRVAAQHSMKGRTLPNWKWTVACDRGRVRASPSSSTTSQARTSRPNPAGSSLVRRSIQARIAAVVSSCSIPSSARTSAILTAELWLRGRTRWRTCDSGTGPSPVWLARTAFSP
jgi:hypothetical protein